MHISCMYDIYYTFDIINPQLLVIVGGDSKTLQHDVGMIAYYTWDKSMYCSFVYLSIKQTQ